MTDATHTPGRTVVGHLTDFPRWEAELIVSIRLWMDGPAGRAEVWNGFARRFGASLGRAEMRRFETFLATLAAHARRPIVRHGPGCVCVGSDEAILRALVHEATRGDLAEASLIASLLMPARHAEPVALMAAAVGEAMQQMAGDGPAMAAPRHETAPRRLH